MTKTARFGTRVSPKQPGLVPEGAPKYVPCNTHYNTAPGMHEFWSRFCPKLHQRAYALEGAHNKNRGFGKTSSTSFHGRIARHAHAHASLSRKPAIILLIISILVLVGCVVLRVTCQVYGTLLVRRKKAYPWTHVPVDICSMSLLLIDQLVMGSLVSSSPARAHA